MTPHLLLLLLFLFLFSLSTGVVISTTSPNVELKLTPKHPTAQELGFFDFDLSSKRGRKLGSFQLCAPCTCCGGSKEGLCLLSPCCYAINCNIPNRPFGYCSFSPKSCDCTACTA